MTSPHPQLLVATTVAHARVLSPHHHFLSAPAWTAGAENPHADTTALERLLALLAVVEEFPFRQDLTDTVTAAFAHGQASWARTPAPSLSARTTAFTGLLESSAAAFKAAAAASHRGEHRLVVLLVDALTVLAHLHDLGPQWESVLRLGLTAARACDHHRALSAFNAALAAHFLRALPLTVAQNRKIIHHSHQAQEGAMRSRHPADIAAALDLRAHHRRVAGRLTAAQDYHIGASQLLHRSGNVHGLALHLIGQARTHLAGHSWSSAAEDSLLAARISEALGDDLLCAEAHLVHTEALWHLEASSTAGTPAAEVALRLLGSVTENRLAVAAAAWVSQWRTRGGQLVRAQDLARLARERASGPVERTQVEEILAQEPTAVTPAAVTSLPRYRGSVVLGWPQGDLGAILDAYPEAAEDVGTTLASLAGTSEIGTGSDRPLAEVRLLQRG